MKLIPEVKTVRQGEGAFCLYDIDAITFPSGSHHFRRSAVFLQKNIRAAAGLDIPLVPGFCGTEKMISLGYGDSDTGSENYRLVIDRTAVRIDGRSAAGLFRGVTTFSQILRNSLYTLPCMEIEDSPDFSFRGFYHDITRGKVPTLDTLKGLVDRLSFYKINQLQLYVEHSFAFRCLPELWVDKDPLTAEEILELDEYCQEHYIDLVPSLSTFGHLYELLRLKRFEHLNELEIKASEIPHNLWDRMAHYTIDPSSQEGFKLVKSMIEEYMPLFSSSYFNICCDETFDLGKGRNKIRAQEEGAGRLYVDFVKKIMGVVQSGGKTPMLWGDIVLNYPDLIDEIPSEALFLNWDYSPDVTDKGVKTFAGAKVKQLVCPGVVGWSRFIHHISGASDNIRKMVTYGKTHNALGVLNTDWGDCGHVNFFANSLHGMAFGAALSWSAETFGDNEIFDRDFSFLEWGENAQEIASMLRRLGDIYPYHFANLYAWVVQLEGLWNIEQKVMDMEAGELQSNYRKSGDILKRLKKIRCAINKNSDVLIDLDEFIWSAEAVGWTNALLCFKKKYEFGQNDSELISAEALISAGYRLLNQFQLLWRKRNKESELRNVVAPLSLALEKIEGLKTGR